MPIYEYQCKSCGYVFDALQKMSDDPLTDCPDCAKPELRKLLSAPNFRLKGGGWYETDFKTANKRNLVDRPDKGTKASDGDKKSGDGDKSAKAGEKSSSAGAKSGGDGDKAA